MVEITFEEQNKVKRMRRTEDSLRDLNNSNASTFEVLEEEKKKGYEKFFEEIIVENFSNITVQKHQFFSAQLSLWSKSHIHT